MRYISDTKLLSLLNALNKDYLVYIPVKKASQRFYKRYKDNDTIDDIIVGEVRSFEPLKPFFFRTREIVAEGFKETVAQTYDKPFAIIGVKACDLKSFKIQDYIFKDHDYQDPFYMRTRQKNFIVSADCTCVIPTCFCLALAVTPYAKEGFDINLSKIRGGYIIESGSEQGSKFTEKYSYLFQGATQEQIVEKENQRDKVAKEVEANIRENKVPFQDMYENVIEKKYEADIWRDEAKTCVECGACNTVCPTCHCFLLYDQKDKDDMARLRIWDSCLIKDFARVAGGANPREYLWMRLRNRFEKKFDFFPKVTDVYACTGCGRCISACPGKIDIRKVLRRLVYDR